MNSLLESTSILLAAGLVGLFTLGSSIILSEHSLGQKGGATLVLRSGEAVDKAGNRWAASDSSEVVDTIQEFRDALAARDSATVEDLLLPDAVILEAGGFETKVEYFDHHFGADASFLENMDRETLRRQVRIEEGTAWVSTSSRMSGTYNGDSLKRASAELMVLRHTSEGWRIAAIHWSSRSLEE